MGLRCSRLSTTELERRGDLFRATGGEQASLVAYREATGQTLPRILLVIDEFHKLFDRDDRLSEHASRLLDNLVRQGRGFGMHCLLASQTLAGLGALGRHTINQIPIRIALQCSDADSRLVLGEENPDALLLSRPGEGIYNPAGGAPAHNQRFQATLIDEPDRLEILRRLRKLAEEVGVLRQPRVFRRNQLADLASSLGTEATGSGPTPSAQSLRLDLGQPMTLEPSLPWLARREGGANLLIVGRSEEVATGLLTAGIASALLQNLPSLTVQCADFMTVDGVFDTIMASLRERGNVAVVRRRGFSKQVADLAELVSERQASDDFGAAPVLWVINGIGRARDLDLDSELDGETQALVTSLEAVLRDGPEVGIHTIMWCDGTANLERRLTRSAQREFGCKVVFTMSNDDSMRLIDSEAATGLGENEALMFDEDRGHLIKFQPFAAPDLEWIAARLETLPT